MSVTKLSISLDPELEQAIRAAAGEASVSSWVAEAARRQLRQQALREAVAHFERENGAFTAEEIKAMRHTR